MFKKIIVFLLLVASTVAGAHCPTNFKPENACLMLDENVIYVYDHNNKHTGPYKDFKDSSMESIKSDGLPMKFSRTATGVYKIESTQPLSSVDVVMVNAKKKIPLKLVLMGCALLPRHCTKE